MSAIKYTEQHEWVRVEGDVAVVGITAYATEQLGDVVYVELPEIGKNVAQNDEVAVVESVKAASEVYAPVGGEVIAVNETLSEAPEKVNADPTGDGWFVKLKIANPSELASLMDDTAYQNYIEGLE